MQIYNTQNNNLYFGSRFNTEVYTTKRALNYLNQTISQKKGFGGYFDSFISRLSDTRDEVLELTQFEKYYLITSNTRKSKSIKIRNNTLIEDLEKFILLHSKKSS